MIMALGTRKPTDVKVRDYINTYGKKKYGIQDSEIGWYNDPSVEGSNTRVSLGGKPVAEPTYLSDDNRTYMDEGKLRAAIDDYANQMGYKDLTATDYTNPYKEKTDALLDDILNTEEFVYNSDEDPLFQQYKKEAMENSSKAYEDTLGNMAGMTGGRQNTWAITAASQARDSYLDDLENRRLDYNELAYQRWLDEQALNQQKLNTVQNLDAAEYQKFSTDRAFDRNTFETDRAFDRSVLESDRNYDFSLDRARRSDFESDRAYDYQVTRDKVLDDQWMQQFNESQRRSLVQEALQRRQISISEANALLAREQFEWSKSEDNPDNAYKRAMTKKAEQTEMVEPDTVGPLYQSMMSADDPGQWLIENSRWLTNDELKALENYLPKTDETIALLEYLENLR